MSTQKNSFFLENQKQISIISNRRQKDQLCFGANNEDSTLGTKAGNAAESVLSTLPCNRHGDKRLKHEVSQVTLDPEFLNGSIRQELKKGMLKYYKSETCAARNIFKAMALSSDSLILS